jgi:hypothetical protein
MNNRPTPETDAAASPHIGFYSCATVTANFARRLERERDEAREELYDIRLNLGEDAEGYTLIHAVCVLQQERDEAREDQKNSKQSLAFALEQLDEAREEAHRFRSLHYSHLGINGSASAFPWEGKLGHE